MSSTTGDFKYENKRVSNYTSLSSADSGRARITGSLRSQAHATFHLMQIEQVIGGVNGDTSAQAIQLRMRFAGQTQVAERDADCVRRGGTESDHDPNLSFQCHHRRCR